MLGKCGKMETERGGECIKMKRMCEKGWGECSEVKGEGRSEDGVDMLLLVLCSSNVLLIVSLDPSPDSSLPGLEKHSTPDNSMKHWQEKCV